MSEDAQENSKLSPRDALLKHIQDVPQLLQTEMARGGNSWINTFATRLMDIEVGYEFALRKGELSPEEEKWGRKNIAHLEEELSRLRPSPKLRSLNDSFEVSTNATLVVGKRGEKYWTTLSDEERARRDKEDMGLEPGVEIPSQLRDQLVGELMSVLVRPPSRELERAA